jgi:FtsP/CotA-like multicopper oxidase with cupredoxin domain
VLLRVINGSSMSNYNLQLGQLKGELIAVDGFQTEPMMASRFPIAVAQRLDIRLALPRGPAAHPVLAVLEGDRRRTGIVAAAVGAAVPRIAETTDTPSPALTLDLERQLRAAEPLKPRAADRMHTLNLTGDMARYIWSINNIAWNKDVPPLLIAKDERVGACDGQSDKNAVSCTGTSFRSSRSTGSGFPGAMRETVLVTPGRRVVVAFDADNPGLWAFHCHLLYHLDADMFTTFRYV